MHFDTLALGKGLTIFSKTENGKTSIELTAFLENEEMRQAESKLLESLSVEFCITDQEGNRVSAVCVPAEQTVTVNSLLIYPHLWQGIEDPYLYKVTASLLKGDELLDQINASHAIRSFGYQPIRGFCLNDKPFIMHAVRYQLPSQLSANGLYQEQLQRDLTSLLELGANTVCLDLPCTDFYFYQMCDRYGLVVWQELTQKARLPILAGTNKDSLFTQDRRRKRDLYFYYQAKWSHVPFVHLCGHEDYLREGDTTRIIVYSNQKKVALYVNGILFEFKESAPEFIFEDVPLQKGNTIISAQAGDCYTSMTLQKARLTS